MRSDSSRPPREGIGEFDSLLAEVQAGRADAWDRCYRWLAPAVAGYLRVQGAADVEDLTSEVFLAMFRNIDSFSGTEANFRSWVFVIAHRRLQDERRRRVRRFNHDEPLDESLAEHVGEPAGASTEEEALRTMGTARVDALCARLAPDQRDVVLLRVLGDLSVDQVAEALDKSPGAVKQLQRRGFEALRRLVDREGVSL